MKLITRWRQHSTIIITLIILVGLGLTAAAQHWLMVDLPHPDELYHYTSAPSTKIFDRHGTLLYEITDPHQGLHTPLTLDEIPQACIQATIATEDGSFYTNPGVDAWAIIRALYINIRGGEILSGGSTITQQLARNLLLSPEERTEVSLTRKLREAILAWRLARTYSKNEILTLYLNEMYYGNLAYGIEAASRTYFGKNAAELDLAECAMLTGLLQNPVAHNPLEHMESAKARQEIVLGLMEKQGYITKAEQHEALREKLQYAAVPFPIEAPHFVMHIWGELERTYGREAIYTQGLQVHTTVDLNIQQAARRIARYRLAELTQQREGEAPKIVRNAAVVVIEPHSGEVLAMLGSPDYFNPRIDGAVNATVATRQPGSSIKPLTYAAAFDPDIAARYGYDPLTAASMLVDVRTAFTTQEGQPYAPANYDRTWRGPVLMRPSLAGSYNLIAVKVLEHIGLDTLVDVSRQAGITTFDNKNFGLALTLGGGEVKLLELTAAYGPFVNGGRSIEPVTIQRITDHTGKIIYSLPPDVNPGEQIMDPRTAYLITDILSDNYARRTTFGDASPLRLSRPAAAKTGTTQDWRDNWTIGYTPDLMVGVWVGNADNEPMRNVSGVTGAAPIWRDLMEALHKGHPVREFAVPDGLVEKEVCGINGRIPLPNANFNLQANSFEGELTTLQTAQYAVACPHVITEKFIPGTEPRQFDDWHQAIAIDRRNGLRATPGCLLDYVAFERYTIYPAEAAEWAKKQGVPTPPEQYTDLCVNVAPYEQPVQVASASERDSAPLIFTSPDPGTIFRVVSNIPRADQKIRVAVRPANGVAVQEIALYLNGQRLTEGTSTLWQMQPGTHVFLAKGIGALGQPLESNPLTIEVVE